jgi:flagellar biosynthesis protein FlhF
MKIKRYMAHSMRAALAQVRAEQGPDAVILSSRRVEEGIEVISAVDYDEALFADATLKRTPAVVPEPAQTPSIAPAAVNFAPREPEPAPQPPLVRPGDAPVRTRPAITVAQPPAVASASRPASQRPQALPGTPVRIPAMQRRQAPAATPAPMTTTQQAQAAAATPVPMTTVQKAQAAAATPAPMTVTAPPMTTMQKAQAAAATLAQMTTTQRAQVAAQMQAAMPRPQAAAVTPTPATPVSGAASEDRGYLGMQRELKDLRELLQGELAHMSWNDKRLREPLQARVLEELTAMDIAPDIALSLAERTPRQTSLENPSHIPIAMLVRHLPVVDRLSTVNGGVIALVGPTGAGKTTTIAKLAARWSMQHGSQDLALVSTDGYRIGAREQLMTYARILGAPMHVANSGKELARVLERLKSKKLILIDTAGMGPRDVRLSEQLAALQLGAARARVLLALPAQGEAQALEEIVRSFARVSPAACILTKVDEAASLGAVISTTMRHKLPISYLCTGQRVPEDLHAAHERRVWLIRLALKLKERGPTRANDGYYARNFGRVPAHA